MQQETFSPLTGLQHLDLSENDIAMLDEDTFGELYQLRRLELMKNKLTVIRASTFSSQQQLVRLNLNTNYLTLIQPHEQALISVSLTLQLNQAYSPMTTNSRNSGLGAASREQWLLHLDPGVQAREGIFVPSCCQLLFSPVGNTSVSKHRNQTNVPTVGWCQTN